MKAKNDKSASLTPQEIKAINNANSIMIALRNPLRQRIIKLLLASPNMPVNNIIQKTKGEQSIISQHLGILREWKVVTTIREGRSIRYSINNRRLNYLLNRVCEIAS